MKAPNLRRHSRHPVMILAENPAHMSHAGFERLLSTFLYGRSAKTRRAYLDDLKTLAAFSGEPTIPDALRLFVSGGQAFANHVALVLKNDLLSKGKAPATVNRKLATLRSLTKMARTIGLLNWSLTAENVRNETYRETSGPGCDVVRELFGLFAAKTDPKSLRDLAILRLLYDLGLRRNEVSSLDLEDIGEGSKIKVLGKGHHSKVVMSLPPETRVAIENWLEVRGESPGPLFVNFDRARKGGRLSGNSIYRNLMSLSRKIGKEVRPHQIRHTAITEACKAAAQAGIGIEEVRQFSRHKDVRTLMIYRDRELDLQGTLAEMVAKAAK